MMLGEEVITLRLPSHPLASLMSSSSRTWHHVYQKKIKDTPTVPWPPRIDRLEEGEEVCELLLKFLTWLKKLKVLRQC